MTQRILPEERLEILRALDSGGKWDSLEDERVCGVCARVFTGEEVGMAGDDRGGYSLQCPTAGCSGTTKQWTLRADSPSSYEGVAKRAVIREFSFLDSFNGTSE